MRVHVGHLRKPPKRRVWRKLHLAVNADTGEVLASDLTNRRTVDSTRVAELLGQIDDWVATFMADGAYDAEAVFEAAQEKGTGQRERNRNIRSMRKLGRRAWHATSG